MSNLVVFIEDRIRDKCVRQTVSVNDRVDAVIESYVDKYGLPRRYFDLSHIEYRLVRAVDGRPLSGQATLREANIAQGELLQLVSREGRLVWRAVQSLFDEIESQIEGQITGKIKDRLVDEAWDRISHRLANIKKTQTEGRRVDELSERVEQVRSTAKPSHSVVAGQENPGVVKPSAVSPVHGVVKAVVAKIGSTALSISVGAAVSLAGAVFVYALTSPPATGTPPERKITIAPATQPPTPPPAVQDTDGDGLNDGHEVEIGTDPNNPDTDQDGLRDGDEVQGCTNPLVPDTDADGLRDGDEMSQGTDPCNSNDPPQDDDGDGLTNDEEYQVGTDPLDPDSDDDGLSDYHEVTGCTNPLVPDTDADGLGDGDEMRQGTDPCNSNDPPRDDDRDGLTNDEEYQVGTDPLDPDSDDDGLSDYHEVTGCTNPLVPDTDADGLWDGDEVSRGTDPCNSNDPPRDDDRDGLTNDEEYRFGTDPLDPDSDHDGLSDYHEVQGCTNPLVPDTDGDGLRDGDEVNEGTDPCNPNPQMPDLIVEIISIDKDTIVWREEPLTGIHYRVSNIGETTADGAVYLRNWTNGAPTSGYMQVEGPIAPGGSVENRFAVGHDDLWPPGDYAVQIEVDYRLLIDEANEDNNFSSTIGFNVVAPSPGSQDFIGSWYNVDPNTRGTTRIDIWQERGVMFVHGYGSCSPTDCDWGTVAAHAEGSSLIAEYEFSFKMSHLTMTLENGLLRVYSTHRFTDGTDRDYDLDEYFSKQTKFPLKLLY